MDLPSKILLQDEQNPNLVWKFEAKDGRLTVTTEQTSETIVNTDVETVNDNETITTQQITRTIVKKTILPINNTTNV